MKKLSRRELARSIAAQLQAGADSHALMQSVAAYMIQHKMLAQTDMLMQDIADELQRLTGHVSAQVRAVYPLTENVQQALKEFVVATTGARSVELAIEQDDSLVGGVVIRTSGREFDASVRRKLNQLAIK